MCVCVCVPICVCACVYWLRVYTYNIYWVHLCADVRGGGGGGGVIGLESSYGFASSLQSHHHHHFLMTVLTGVRNLNLSPCGKSLPMPHLASPS